MHSRHHRGVQPFGRRRPTSEDPDLGHPARAASALPWAVRVSGLIGLVAVLAAAQLARWSVPAEAPPAITLAAGRVPEDPVTTGAIPAARATRLDPCLAPAAAHLRP
ncbi:hypothetical protein ACLBX9_05735 [Methylobacterium sp. A49B]